MLTYAAESSANPRKWQVHVLRKDTAEDTPISSQENGGAAGHRGTCFSVLCLSGNSWRHDYVAGTSCAAFVGP